MKVMASLMANTKGMGEGSVQLVISVFRWFNIIYKIHSEIPCLILIGSVYIIVRVGRSLENPNNMTLNYERTGQSWAINRQASVEPGYRENRKDLKSE